MLSVTLESLDPKDQSMWKMIKRVMRFPTPPPSLVTPVSEKANAISQSLEAHIQPITDRSVPAVTEKVDEADCCTPASEYKKINAGEVQVVIRGLNVGRHHAENCLICIEFEPLGPD